MDSSASGGKLTATTALLQAIAHSLLRAPAMGVQTFNRLYLRPRDAWETNDWLNADSLHVLTDGFEWDVIKFVFFITFLIQIKESDPLKRKLKLPQIWKCLLTKPTEEEVQCRFCQEIFSKLQATCITFVIQIKGKRPIEKEVEADKKKATHWKGSWSCRWSGNVCWQNLLSRKCSAGFVNKLFPNHKWQTDIERKRNQSTVFCTRGWFESVNRWR